MKKTLLCLILALISIFSFTLVACGPNGGGGGPSGPVANAELDEYNQIVDQMKDVFAQVSNQPASTSANTLMKSNNGKGEKQLNGTNGASLYNSQALFASSKESLISGMFTMMDADSSKVESNDTDYYAYGIDFSTMTARIAGYAANNYFKVSSFYGLNILMDYGGSTVINASVEKEGSTIKTYLFTTFKNSRNELFKEYNYAEINFISKTDFNILVIDYAYDEQDNITSQTMIYASSNKDFFLLSGDIENPKTGMVFFDLGEAGPAYVLQGDKTNTINSLYSILSQEFALSSQDKAKIGSLYNTQNYSISYEQVVEAKTELGIIINMDDEEYVAPIGFVSNKNAEDIVGRKTLQAFVDDGESVDGTTLTIPDEFNYLSGGIHFDADIDTLVIPSSIKGVVVYNTKWEYSVLDDSLCYYEIYEDQGTGQYRPWGGSLFSYVSDDDGNFWMSNSKAFKKFILLDDNGDEVNETDAFALDNMGNLWIKDSKGKKNYLWGFVSEPTGDTLHLPSPTYETINGRCIEVEHFYGGNFLETLKNKGTLDEYSANIKHLILDGYISEEVPEMGITAGFKLLNSNLLKCDEYQDGTKFGLKLNLDTLTINNISDGATVNLASIFAGMRYTTNVHGAPIHETVCQTTIQKVILNGDFESFAYSNGFVIYNNDNQMLEPGGDGNKQEGGFGVTGDGGFSQIKETFTIAEEYEINSTRPNVHFNGDSAIYGQKVVEIYGDTQDFPVYPDAETIIIKSNVTSLSNNKSFVTLNDAKLPNGRFVTVEFENIAGIEHNNFYVRDLMYPFHDMQMYPTTIDNVKFNVSERFMENLIASLEYSYSAQWLNQVVNSGAYQIEYAPAIPGEEEFTDNFSWDDYGFIFLKETASITTLEINDDFLRLIKQFFGKELSENTISLYPAEGEPNVTVILNITKEFYDANGPIPNINGAKAIEVASGMKEFDDLTAILDRVSTFRNDTKLIFNGTKQELLDRTGSWGYDYIAYLLWSDYDQIVFADGETLYLYLRDMVFTYEDERIKFAITYDGEQAISYFFEDKLNPNATFTETTGYVSGTDGDNSWMTIFGIHVSYDKETLNYNGMEFSIPVCELSIYYRYGYNGDGSYNEIYGTFEERYNLDVKLFMLPPTITITPNV